MGSEDASLAGLMEVVHVPVCAICQHLSITPRAAAGTVGLLTGEAVILDAAVDRFADAEGEGHVVVHACPEHAVDVYRGRIEGVRMAWRLGAEPAIPPRQSPAAASSSPA